MTDTFMTDANTKKLTDKDIYKAIAEGTLDDLDADVIEAWANKKIDQLTRKAAKAKENAAKKKEAGDALTEAVKEALTGEFETIATIAARLEGEDITVSKVSYRLNALSKTEGSGVEKGDITVKEENAKTRHLVGYRLAD